MNKPLIHKKFRLEKFQGKGGWTFVRVPLQLNDSAKPFGWKKIRGFIDNYEFRHYQLMPMGDGRLFLPVKAEIRKKINKKEGDWVTVILYRETGPVEIPIELEECLRDEPGAYQFFMSLSDSEKKFYIEWIYGAKREETKIKRLARTIERLTKGLKLYDKE